MPRTFGYECREAEARWDLGAREKLLHQPLSMSLQTLDFTTLGGNCVVQRRQASGDLQLLIYIGRICHLDVRQASRRNRVDLRTLGFLLDLEANRPRPEEVAAKSDNYRVVVATCENCVLTGKQLLTI